MSNTETMQLDLFEGKILTTEQQIEINSFIKRQSKNAVSAQKNVDKITLMLDEAGFVYGQDYSSNFEVHEVTREREFGYSYNNTNFDHETTYLNSVGGIFLWVNTIKEGKLEVYKSGVSSEDDKLQCTSVTKQYRYYKPSSLLVKYNEHNQRIVGELEYKNKQKIALNTIVAKYQKLYPEAKVTIDSDYHRKSRNYDSFPTVKVEFQSGSYVSFKLGYGNEIDQEVFHKKYDVQSESAQDLLIRFNNQKTK